MTLNKKKSFCCHCGRVDIAQAAEAVTVTAAAVLTTRVGRRRKFGEVSCTETRESLRINSNGRNGNYKSSTGAGYFGSAFPAICYHRGVVAA